MQTYSLCTIILYNVGAVDSLVSSNCNAFLRLFAILLFSGRVCYSLNCGRTRWEGRVNPDFVPFLNIRLFCPARPSANYRRPTRTAGVTYGPCEIRRKQTTVHVRVSKITHLSSREDKHFIFDHTPTAAGGHRE